MGFNIFHGHALGIHGQKFFLHVLTDAGLFFSAVGTQILPSDPEEPTPLREGRPPAVAPMTF